MTVSSVRSRRICSKNVYQLGCYSIIQNPFRKTALTISKTTQTESSIPRNRSSIKSKRLEKICEHCNDKFKVIPSRINSKFCSRGCCYEHSRKLSLESVKPLIIYWFQKGMSSLEIGNKLGVSRTTIQRIEQKLGLTYQPHGRIMLESSHISNLPEVEKAYIAGLFDGEGNISLTISNDGGIRNEIVICNTDEKIIEVCQILFPNKRKRMNAGYNRNSTMHILYVHDKRNIILILEALIPYLKLKRKRAELMIEFCKNRIANFRKPLTNMEKALIAEVRLLNSEKGKVKRILAT